MQCTSVKMQPRYPLPPTSSSSIEVGRSLFMPSVAMDCPCYWCKEHPYSLNVFHPFYLHFFYFLLRSFVPSPFKCINLISCSYVCPVLSSSFLYPSDATAFLFFCKVKCYLLYLQWFSLELHCSLSNGKKTISCGSIRKTYKQMIENVG